MTIINYPPAKIYLQTNSSSYTRIHTPTLYIGTLYWRVLIAIDRIRPQARPFICLFSYKVKQIEKAATTSV